MRSKPVSVVVAAMVLVGGANLAVYAANGSPLLLGSKNSESKTATVTNTGKGPALKLNSKPSAPSLAVSSTKKVVRLNADRVDGLEGKSLQTNTTVYSLPTQSGTSTSFVLEFNGLAPGLYQTSYSIFTTLAGDNAILCRFRPANSSAWYLSSYGSEFNTARTNNASGVLDLRSAPLLLDCSAGANITLSNAGVDKSQVWFTRIDSLTSKSAIVAPRGLVKPNRAVPGQ